MLEWLNTLPKTTFSVMCQTNSVTLVFVTTAISQSLYANFLRKGFPAKINFYAWGHTTVFCTLGDIS